MAGQVVDGVLVRGLGAAEVVVGRAVEVGQAGGKEAVVHAGEGRRSRSPSRCRHAVARVGPSRPLGPHVNDLRSSCSGSFANWVAIAPRTASAPCPARAGPFLTRAVAPQPGIAGKCSSIVNRLVRSTKVPMAELSRPMIRSPSQWGHHPVLGLRAPLADHDLRGDELLAPSPGTGPRHSTRARSAGTRSARAAARRDPAHTAPGRSARARSSLNDLLDVLDGRHSEHPEPLPTGIEAGEIIAVTVDGLRDRRVQSAWIHQ